MYSDYWRSRDLIRTSCHPGDLGRFPDTLTQNEKIASQWLLLLYQQPDEKLWFADFAQHYSCEMEAAFVYLNLESNQQ